MTVRSDAPPFERRHLQLFSRPYPADGKRLCLTAFLDVSAEVQRKVLDSQRQATLDALSSNIAVLHRWGRITAVNAGWHRFALENRATPETAAGVGVDYIDACANRLVGDRDREADQALEGIHRVMEGTQPDFTLEYPCHAPSEQRWFVMNLRPLGRDSGGVVVAHTDITSRVLAQQEADRRREELAHAARISSVALLTGSLIHEISQPLAAARLYVETAMSRSGAGDGGSDRNFLQPILSALRDQVDRAIGIVQGLRRFLSRGAPTLQATELDARIRASMALVKPLASRKRVRLEFDSLSAPVWIRVNPLQIEQVLINLLANGIEAIDDADSQGTASPRQPRCRRG